ncbi:hypothetical protein SELMODRAFT_165549 [Selaginella moellendorffii]|uniref:Amino acid transporter transmembrane domain-containing protein n=1 Tax=Selaginella moellendorffii TaxID=88036 RepID=D8QU36_SELML|nr:hypothetical protein SELMODRAFT_79164 [Selaginella moellendorffii]EFJ36406.1 hypothetical protein SELMODRAFT_165549 [Selaginella moellendorffii]
MASTQSSKQSWFYVLFLEGTSVFDAWLNSSSFQVSQVLLTLPYSFAQLGFVSGIAYQILYAAMGCWSCYMTSSLYVIYREKRAMRANTFVDYEAQSILWYEVLDGLLGSNWKLAGLVVNLGYQILTCVIFLVGCSSLSYLLNSYVDKRTWTILLVFCFILIVFIPRAQHYRIWSCIGIVATSYTAWYITIATIYHGKNSNATHSAPNNTAGYFVGATNLLYTFGGHAVTIEIVDAMKKPEKFKTVYFYCSAYILTLTLPSAIAVYWAFGDSMAHHAYSIVVLPDSMFRVTAIVLMLVHQFMQFGFLSLPVFMKWERLLGIHGSSNYYLKSISRIPVVLVMWFVAIMVPFIGLIDSVVGAVFASFSVYVLPCTAHMISVEQPPSWMPWNWIGMYCVNLAVVLWVLIVGVGFGGWASLVALRHNINSFGLFPQCYQCKSS